jgi:hypothetical protein
MAELASTEIDQFIQEGYVRLEHAFPRELADECRAFLWRATGCEPGNPATWTQPVVRLGYLGQEPFRRAVNTPASWGLRSTGGAWALAASRRCRHVPHPLPEPGCSRG